MICIKDFSNSTDKLDTPPYGKNTLMVLEGIELELTVEQVFGCLKIGVE
jgi:hypothetical protein